MKKQKGLYLGSNTKMTAKEVAPRTIVFFDDKSELQLMVRRGVAWCAYIGVPLKYRITKNYNNLDVQCHGGLTFGEKGSDKEIGFKEGYFWYGWDYGHAGDYTHFSLEIEGEAKVKEMKKKPAEYRKAEEMFDKMNKNHLAMGDKDWKLGDVVKELYEVAEQFNKIIKGRKSKKNLIIKK